MHPLLIQVALVFVNLLVGAHLKENHHLYQDLTELIDSCLQEAECHDTYKFNLKQALMKSTFVYYSTDLLLNDISHLTSVINLLNSTKPPSTRYHIMLSLRYTNNENRFFWQRLDDVFYDLSPNITPETKAILNQHLSYVVLDWRTETCKDSKTFFSKIANFYGYGFELADAKLTVDVTSQNMPSYSFPKYTKNFFRMICEELSECSDIPVGVNYNSVQIGCADYLINQARDADFVLISTTFSAHRQFPFSYEVFHGYMTTLKNQNERFIGRDVNKGIVYMVDIKDPPSATQVKGEWKREWSNLESLLSSSKFYERSVEEMITETHNNAKRLLPAFLLRYVSHLYDNKQKQSGWFVSSSKFSAIVLGKSTTNDVEKITIKTYSHLIPHLYTDEVEATPCSLKSVLANSGSGKIIMNAYTWRAFLRHHKQIMNPNLNCSTYCDKNCERYKVDAKTEAMIIFDENIIVMWKDVEKYVTKLIKQPHTTVATLQKVIFPEIGINEITQKYITTDLSNLSVGCEVDFNQEKLEILQLKMIFSESIKFDRLMKELCPKIFSTVGNMIWNIDKVNLSLGNELIVVTRLIFMKEFPRIYVLLKLTPGAKYSWDYIDSWSQYYRVSVAI